MISIPNDIDYNAIYSYRGTFFRIVSVHYAVKHIGVSMRNLKYDNWTTEVILFENETLDSKDYKVDRTATILYSKGNKINVRI